MAKCEYCGLEMSEADGCKCSEFKIGGEWFPRIRFGRNGDLAWGYREFGKEDRCPDCSCRVGCFHHPGCDMEACPKCGEQSLSCGCDLTQVAWHGKE